MKSEEEKKSAVPWLGVLLTFAGVALFSTVELASKSIARSTVGAGLVRIDGYTLVVLRFLVTGVILALCGIPEFRRRQGHMKWNDIGVFMLNGLVGIALSISFFHFAIDAFTNASSAAVVMSANAAFTIIFARFINGEEWNWRKWLAVCIGVCGIACFVCENGIPSRGSLIASALMTVSALFFGCSVCLTRRYVSRYGASMMMGMSSIFGALAVLPVALLTAQPGVVDSIAAAAMPLLYLVLIGTLLAYLFYYEGIKRVSAFAASMIFLLKPVLACTMAVTLGGENMNGWTLAGAVIIVGSLLLTINWKAVKR